MDPSQVLTLSDISGHRKTQVVLRQDTGFLGFQQAFAQIDTFLHCPYILWVTVTYNKNFKSEKNLGRGGIWNRWRDYVINRDWGQKDK